MRKQNKAKGQKVIGQERQWKGGGEGTGEIDRESTAFTQRDLLTFLTDPAQLSLLCHLLVCNHYQTVCSPDTNKDFL